MHIRSCPGREDLWCMTTRSCDSSLCQSFAKGFAGYSSIGRLCIVYHYPGFDGFCSTYSGEETWNIQAIRLLLCYYGLYATIRACLMLRGFTLFRREIARLRRAKDLVCG